MSETTAKPESSRVFIGAKIPQEIARKLEEVAASEMTSVSHVVRRILRAGVEHYCCGNGPIKEVIHCAHGPQRTVKAQKKG